MNTVFQLVSSKKALILEYIWKHPGAHRKEIASFFGLHPNIVTEAIRKLIGEGWVAEGNRKSVSAGRSPIALSVGAGKKVVVAAAYTREGLQCGLVNAAGEVVENMEIVPVSEKIEAFVALLAETTRRLREGFSGEVIGVGIADPGMIDSRRGELVRSSVFPEWRQVPLASLLEAQSGLSVFLEDMTRARAMAQYLTMPEVRQAGGPMLYLDYGDGVGVAFVGEQGVWRGAGFAGEIGHVIIDSNGARCRCGARGCLESRVNPKALMAVIQSHLDKGVQSVLQGKPLTAERLFGAALDGDRLAQSVIDEETGDLTLTLAILSAAYHPRFLVVGGENPLAIKFLAGRLAVELPTRVLSEQMPAMEVREGSASPSLALIGAGLATFDAVIRRGRGDARPGEKE